MIPNCKKNTQIKSDTSIVYWDRDTTNLNLFQSILNNHNEGKDVLIITHNAGKKPTIIPFYADEKISNNKYILTSVIDSTRILKPSFIGYNQLQLVQSRIDIIITNNTVSAINYTVTAENVLNYLDATSPNTNSTYIPTLDNHPATKRYVDEQIQNNYSTEEILTKDTWIDGKPIYRKVINITSEIKDLNKFAHNIENLSTIINICGIGQVAANTYVPINHALYNGDRQYTSCVCVEGSNIVFYMSTNREKWINANVILEYTKSIN